MLHVNQPIAPKNTYHTERNQYPPEHVACKSTNSTKEH